MTKRVLQRGQVVRAVRGSRFVFDLGKAYRSTKMSHGDTIDETVLMEGRQMKGLINCVSLEVRRVLRTFLVCVLVFIPVVGRVNAAPLIHWDFEGTVSALTDDPLGIDGEVIRLHLEFDASDVWIRGPNFAGGSAFYFPTVVSSASITGVHTIATNSTAPAARYLEALGSGGISEALNNPNYVDFIIDGVQTETLATNGPAVLAPSAGDNLVIAHLRDDLGQFVYLSINGVLAYEFTNQTITIGCSTCPKLLTALSPAMVWIGLKNSDAVGLRLDLQAEVFLNEIQVREGALYNVVSGSSGFNNAKLNAIPLNLFAPVEVPADAELVMTLSVRRTCFGGGHNSGTPRLWYNGQPTDSGAQRDAGTRFGATIADTSSAFFLRDGFVLSTTAGTAKQFVDVPVNSQTPCPNRPFIPFGTWSLTQP